MVSRYLVPVSTWLAGCTYLGTYNKVPRPYRRLRVCLPAAWVGYLGTCFRYRGYAPTAGQLVILMTGHFLSAGAELQTPGKSILPGPGTPVAPQSQNFSEEPPEFADLYRVSSNFRATNTETLGVCELLSLKGVRSRRAKICDLCTRYSAVPCMDRGWRVLPVQYYRDSTARYSMKLHGLKPAYVTCVLLPHSLLHALALDYLVTA